MSGRYLPHSVVRRRLAQTEVEISIVQGLALSKIVGLCEDVHPFLQRVQDFAGIQVILIDSIYASSLDTLAILSHSIAPLYENIAQARGWQKQEKQYCHRKDTLHDGTAPRGNRVRRSDRKMINAANRTKRSR